MIAQEAVMRAVDPCLTRPVRCLAGALAVVLAACADDPTTAPKPRPPTAQALVFGPIHRGRILFHSTVTGDEELFSIRENGSDLLRLTYSPGADRDAVYSPDGSRIAFVSARGTNAGLNIFVMQSDGTKLKQLTSPNTFRKFAGITWSPDGAQIVFSASLLNLYNMRLDLFSVSSTGSPVTRLTNTAGTDEEDPAFSPLGDRIAFAAPEPPETHDPTLWTIAPDGSNRTHIIGCKPCRYPAWSPDGFFLSYTELMTYGDLEVPYALRIIASDGQYLSARAVASSASRASFSPDGIKLVYTRTNGVQTWVETVTADGSNQTPLTNFDVPAIATSWGR
jgi:Tol biopolymer transport system component